MVLWIGPIIRAVTGQERQRPGYNAYHPTTYQTTYAGQYPGPDPYRHHHHHPHPHHHQPPQAPVGYMVPAVPQPLDRWERKQARKADRLARKAQRHGLPMPVVVAAPAPAPYGYDYGRPTGRTLPGGSYASDSRNRTGNDVAVDPPTGPPPKSALGHTRGQRASLDEEHLRKESDLPPSYESVVAGPSRRRSVEVLSPGPIGGR